MSGGGDRVAVEAAVAWPEDTAEDAGVVANWFASEGRRVDAGETICEIQVEKVSVDVPAPVAGELVEIEREADDEIARDETLCWIDPD